MISKQETALFFMFTSSRKFTLVLSSQFSVEFLGSMQNQVKNADKYKLLSLKSKLTYLRLNIMHEYDGLILCWEEYFAN